MIFSENRAHFSGSCSGEIFHPDQNEGGEENRLGNDQDHGFPTDIEDAVERGLHAHGTNSEQQCPARDVAGRGHDSRGKTPNEFSAARARNPSTKPGTNGGRFDLSVAAAGILRNAREKIRTTGASMMTRISLTSVAVSPVSFETEKPAPTTWATS